MTPRVCPECGETLLYGAGHLNCPGKMPEEPFPDAAAPPFTSMREAAFAMHEMYLAYLDAGFNDEQAMYLLAQAVRPERSGV